MSADRSPPPPRTRQAVVLVGGRGTRLGELTRATPKPLMAIDDDHVFLDFLLENLARQGFDRLLLLAGHYGDQIESRYRHRRIRGATVTVAIEPEPMGTAGALRWSRDRLEGAFLLLNGDTYFDIAYRALEKALDAAPDALAALALRRVEDAARYGLVDVEDGRIRRFREKAATQAGALGLINGGIYLMRREIVDVIPDGPASLETDVFPGLAARGRLIGAPRAGYFIDIGLPDTLAQARAELPQITRRPALFLDRDGVINVDHGYVHRWSEFDPMPGAAETIAAFNDAGWLVFVVTNQAGVAHGYYEEAAVHLLHEQIRDWLATQGAHIDAFYHCPYHPEAALDAWRAHHPDRKPGGGMLLRAFAEWPVLPARSFLIGDRETDVAAARAVGIEGHLFAGDRLDAFLESQGLWPATGASKE
jgi:D,D-heptose 1,7-bisphosphate phosphatase